MGLSETEKRAVPYDSVNLAARRVFQLTLRP